MTTSIAYHEAGHAVIGSVLRISHGYATIIPEGSARGHVWTGDREPWRAWAEGKFRTPRAAVHARVIMLMAGAEAEAVLLGADSGGDRYDRKEIRKCLDTICYPQDRHRLEQRLRRITRKLVKRHAAEIARMAETLLVSQTVGFDDFVSSEDEFGPREDDSLPF